jgi:pyrroline-5-carboxylate reductase
MGSAILGGVLDGIRQEKKNEGSEQKTSLSHIIACTKSRSSADKLREQYAAHSSLLDFQHGDNLLAITQADVIILGCKPYLVQSVLEVEGVSEALAGNFVISIIAGKILEVLSEYIVRGESKSLDKTNRKAKTFVARAIPTIACRVRQSMTIVELPQDCPSSFTRVIGWIFSQIGQVKVLDADLFDIGTMLMASLASVSVAFDGLLDGSVANGPNEQMPRKWHHSACWDCPYC